MVQEGAAALVMGLVLSGLTGCSGGGPAPTKGEIPTPHALPAPVDDGESHLLARDVPFAELSVPADVREGAPLGTGAALRDLELVGGDANKGFTFRAPNPVKPRGLFFFRAQPGMRLSHGEIRQLPFRPRQRRTTHLSWSMDRDFVTVYDRSQNVPENLVLHYPKAVERERAMHYALAREAGLVDDEADFVRATVQSGWTSRQGLLLPAPTTAGFDVEVPPSGVLTFAPGVARPELADLPPSDGCTLAITVDGQEVWKRDLQPLPAGSQAEPFPIERLDLSAHAGKKVRLAFATTPGASPVNDFCFVGEPILAPVKEKPRRVVMVFVDTVRPDHLSFYGYDRPTSPRLGAWAKSAAVFENARSIAPWTLPSARTVVTGRHPEHYASAAKLPDLLAAEGFATGMIAGNVYLTANFGMNAGWDLHTVGLFPPAQEVTDDALEWLGDHHGQDSLLMVHYMSAHLPYKEPQAYKDLGWAGERPEQFKKDSFILRDVRTADRQGMGDPGRAYVAGRYDQTLRWLDDEVGRLVSALDDDDVVVYFSDHGEELWDHDGFEHGHTLHDELLRVPLVIKAPGMQAGRNDVPVSLLDVAPTVLDLLGVEAEMDGTSLVKVAAGDPTLSGMFRERPQTVGRPLYGTDRWGVIDGDKKYTTWASHESVFDLAADPGEQADLGDSEAFVAPLRKAMGEGLGTSAEVGYRFLPSNGATGKREIQLTVEIPGGIKHVFKGGDPHQQTPVTLTPLEGDQVQITWHRGNGGREVYVIPNRPVAEVTRELKGRVAAGRRYDWTMPEKGPITPTEGRQRLHQLSIPEGAITLYWGFAPVPPEGAIELDATDDETTDALKELGYAEDAREGDEAKP